MLYYIVSLIPFFVINTTLVFILKKTKNIVIDIIQPLAAMYYKSHQVKYL